MLPLIGLIFGLVFGWVRAARRGGGMADRFQYAIGHGLAFGLASFALALIIVKLGIG